MERYDRLVRGTKLTGWRKIAAATWEGPNDPQIYGALDVDATKLIELVESARAAGHHLTPTHVVGRAVARSLAAVPDLNVRILGGRAVPRETIDVFFITAVAGGHDLSGVKVCEADRKTVYEVAEELGRRARAMKAGNDPDLARSKGAMEILPVPLLRVALRVSAWVAGDRAWAIRALGLAATPFGSAMVTSVGMFGLPMGFAPLTWMYKVPLLVLVGEIADKPVAVDGRVEIRKMLPITFTVDHRWVDGWHLSRALEAFKEYLTDPARFEPAPS